jgi:hypothetical protein
MKDQDYLAAAAALFNAFAFEKLVPLGALIVMVIGIGWLLGKAQAKPDFHIEQMLQDETGKASASRIFAFGAWAFSSWDLMAARLSGTHSAEYYWGYLFAWSSALTLAKLADRWDGSMPFGKGKG